MLERRKNMATCKTCVHFRTDNDCDGPEWEWCAIEQIEAGYYVSGHPACSCYEKAEEDYDWDD